MNQGHQRCHYDTLGVSRNASNEEVKTAFRKLSLKTHPDLAGAGVCAESFKKIAEAASVLTNPKLRQAYDQKISARATLNHFRRSPLHDTTSSTFRDQQPRGYTAILVNLFRPRNLILGPIAFFATVSAIQYSLGIENKKNQRDDSSLVQVWMNPETGRYETPAPWDPVYQKLQPKLVYIPKNEVHLRKQ
jgi:DnaJ-class molecular chaperone